MNKIYAIAVNTFKEVIRDKIFYTLLFFAVMMVGSSLVLSSLGSIAQTKVLADLALSGISIFGVVISIFVGIGLVEKEIERKTIYTIVSKPISRPGFLAGKYLGLSLTLLAYTALMALIFMLMMLAYSGHVPFGMLRAVLLSYFEFLVLIAVAMMFSTFSTPVLSAAYTLAVFVIGRLAPDLMSLADGLEKENASTSAVLKIIYYVVPNLDNFNIRAEVVHMKEVSVTFMAGSVAYGLLYSFIMLLIAVMVFQGKDFK